MLQVYDSKNVTVEEDENINKCDHPMENETESEK